MVDRELVKLLPQEVVERRQMEKRLGEIPGQQGQGRY